MEQQSKLIQCCIAGDRNAQKQLYDIFSKKMMGVCLRYIKNIVEAEEVLQEGFVQVFRSLPGFKNEGSLEGWIRKIMVYCAIRHFRSQTKMYPVISVDVNVIEYTSDYGIISNLGEKELLQLVYALPPTYRLIFNLYVFEGMKHKEIAALLGISEGTSKSNLFDAKSILKKAVIRNTKIARQNI